MGILSGADFSHFQLGVITLWLCVWFDNIKAWTWMTAKLAAPPGVTGIWKGVSSELKEVC